MKRILINPGHSPKGDPDPGVVNQVSRRKESDVVARIGAKVETHLRNAGFMTRLVQSDSLAKIVSAANVLGADAFVSIHCNGSNTHQARGTESWFWYGSELGEVLARIINTEIENRIPGITKRGVKDGNFYVLRETMMPAVLVETAFLDNPHDEDLLLKYEDEFAIAIAYGTSKFLS